MDHAAVDLRSLFDLEPHGPDTFVGMSPPYPWGGLFGGHIVAQSLHAAAKTVDPTYLPHSLRAYFIRRGDITEPVRYEIDRIRNGRSFCTRRVVVRQSQGAILNLEASFQVAEESADVTVVQMPTDLPDPLTVADNSWSPSFDRRTIADTPATQGDRTGLGRTLMWMKVNETVGDDELLNRCWLSYLSDEQPFEAVRRALRRAQPPEWELPVDPFAPMEWKSNGASLDHAVWFHRPFRADSWHLYDVSCHSYTGGRGLTTGHVFAADGTHVATVAQEILHRKAR